MQRVGLAAVNGRMGRHGQPPSAAVAAVAVLSRSLVRSAAPHVRAHQADGPEAQLDVAADRLLISGRRVNGDPVMTTLLEEEPGQQPDSLVPTPRPWCASEVDVDAGMLRCAQPFA